MAAGAALPYPSSDDLLSQSGGAGPSVPKLPPIQGQGAGPSTAPPAAQASPSQPAAPGLGAAQPQGGIAQGTGNKKGEIATPDVQLKFNPDKLKQAQTTLDVLNAATAQSRKQYMDWWEKQHGDIDEKYDHLKSQIGQRPSDDEPETKKEKFAALLEFGLHLMKASSAPSSNQGAALTGAVADSVEGEAQAHAQKVKGEQGAYDTQANAIESARDEEQKGIGTPAQAMKASDDQAKTASTATKDQAQALKAINDVDTQKAASMGAPTYVTAPDGSLHQLIRDADGKSHMEPVLDLEGKPTKGRVLGRTTGSGVDQASKDPAAVRTHKYLTNVLGIDPDTAAKIVFKPKTGNPSTDHLAVYKSALAATAGDPEKASRIADQYTLDQYGAGALARQNGPVIPTPGAPPAAALQGLKPGEVRNFGAKGKWTIGIDGKARLVSGSPQTIQ